VAHVGDDVAEDVYQFHPATRLNQDEHTPQVAVSASIAVLPMQDDNNVDVDKRRNNQEQRRDNRESSNKVSREHRYGEER